MTQPSTSSPITTPHIWCAIPVFNNAATIVAIAQRTLLECSNLLIIDDGSTDADLAALLKHLPIHFLRHPKNQGKGAALQSAFAFANEHAAQFLITLDADGQHFPEDIPTFLPHLSPNTILLGHRTHLTGHRSSASTFGQSFSDFWITLETGHTPLDSQSGFRAYPIPAILQLPLRTAHYNFEVELLTRALWAGLTTQSLPIHVHYPPPADRISHFRPFKDNLRLTLLHTRLIARELLPIPHRNSARKGGANDRQSQNDPLPLPPKSTMNNPPINNLPPLTLPLTIFLSLLLPLAHPPIAPYFIPLGALIALYLTFRLHLGIRVSLLCLALATAFTLTFPHLPTQLACALLGPNIPHAHFIGAHLIAFPTAILGALVTYALARQKLTKLLNGLTWSKWSPGIIGGLMLFGVIGGIILAINLSPPHRTILQPFLSVFAFTVFGVGTFTSWRQLFLVRKRRRWRRDGCCLSCGYDLRGTRAAGLNRCPECGTRIT